MRMTSAISKTAPTAMVADVTLMTIIAAVVTNRLR